MVDHVVIMAGGAGKRLWPASLGSRPKQFLKIEGNGSLFRGTLERALALKISGKILIITHKDHLPAAQEECGFLSPRDREKIVILGEPLSRNTAPALALAAAWLSLAGGEKDTLLVMAADHIISPLEAFIQCVETASQEGRDGYLVPFGLVPQGPHTGYGYLEAGSPAGGGREVLSFREKPDLSAARDYLARGNYFWNSGMFVYRGDVFQQELKAWEPAVARVFENPAADWFTIPPGQFPGAGTPTAKLQELYRSCPGISVDYAVMERSRKVRMVEGNFQWNDVGSWDVIADLNPPPQAPVYQEQARGNFVYADCPVALCGVEDLLVVAANGRVLICKKGSSQLVKEAAEKDISQK